MSGDQDINKKNNLADQSYWDNSYKDYQFEICSPNDKIRKWLEQYIPVNNNGSCFEIGCFPGRYLSVMGQLGYELNGIDTTPRAKKDMADWLLKCNYKVGEISQEDIFAYKSEKKYDVVCSFGFIEHFKNWAEVVRIQAGMVKPGGLLVIEVPNFSGLVQHLIHYWLDYENLQRHFLGAMHPGKWEEVIKPMGFETIYCGYFKEFEYWLDKPPEGYLRNKMWNWLKEKEEVMKKWAPNSSFYSPYCGLIARKK